MSYENSWRAKFDRGLIPVYIDAATSLRFAEIEEDRKLYCLDSHEMFERSKPDGDMWYVNLWGGGERGPFGTFEEACEDAARFWKL